MTCESSKLLNAGVPNLTPMETKEVIPSNKCNYKLETTFICHDWVPV